MPSFDDMTTGDLRAAVEAMLAEIGRRDAEVEARATVVAAVEGHAELRGLTVLAANGVAESDDEDDNAEAGEHIEHGSY